MRRRTTTVAIEPFFASSGNLSEAWAEVTLRLLEPGVSDLSSVVVSVSEFDDNGPVEMPTIRRRLDAELRAHGKRSIETVANTIFPESLWQPDIPDNDPALYARYERIWPRFQRDPANRHGVYFRRLTSFRPSN